MKIEITNGFAVIKDTMDRKSLRELVEQNDILTAAREGKNEGEISKAAMASDDLFVLNMLSEIEISGRKEEPSTEIVGALDGIDFEKILEACVEVLKEYNERKKKMKEKSKSSKP